MKQILIPAFSTSGKKMHKMDYRSGFVIFCILYLFLLQGSSQKTSDFISSQLSLTCPKCFLYNLQFFFSCGYTFIYVDDYNFRGRECSILRIIYNGYINLGLSGHLKESRALEALLCSLLAISMGNLFNPSVSNIPNLYNGDNSCFHHRVLLLRTE